MVIIKRLKRCGFKLTKQTFLKDQYRKQTFLKEHRRGHVGVFSFVVLILSD